MRVPEDVSVVGFHDNPDLTISCPVPLTSLYVDREELGRQGMRVLLQRLRYPDSPPLQIAVGVKPVWRESCGIPEAGKAS